MNEFSSSPNAFRAHPSATVKTREQRIGGIAFVAFVHVVMVYALLTTLGIVEVPKTASNLTVVNVAELPKEIELPKPLPPNIEAPQVQNVIVPVVTLDYVPAQSTAITLPPAAKAPEPPPQTVAQAAPPAPEPAFVPPMSIAETHTFPQYPPASLRLGEHGTLHLLLTISDEGVVAGATIVDSSGYRRLDEAAIAWIKNNWRYRPAREHAKAVTARIEAEVNFVLYNQASPANTASNG